VGEQGARLRGRSCCCGAGHGAVPLCCRIGAGWAPAWGLGYRALPQGAWRGARGAEGATQSLSACPRPTCNLLRGVALAQGERRKEQAQGGTRGLPRSSAGRAPARRPSRCSQRPTGLPMLTVWQHPDLAAQSCHCCASSIFKHPPNTHVCLIAAVVARGRAKACSSGCLLSLQRRATPSVRPLRCAACDPNFFLAVPAV
jgi:hypothetical protein